MLYLFMECPICFENNTLVITECHHSYCITCLKKLYKCAICRKKLMKIKLCDEIKKYKYKYLLEYLNNDSTYDPDDNGPILIRTNINMFS